MSYHILNPLTKAISTTRAYDDGVKTLTLEPESITTFDNEVDFNHIRDYAIEIILNERNLWHFEQEREKVRKEISKEL